MTERTPTKLDAIAEDYVAEYAKLSPLTASYIGLPGYDHLLDDFSPEGHQARYELNKQTLRQIAETEAVDDVDRVTQMAMQERLGLEVEMHDADEDLADLKILACPAQGMRDIFDLMPTATVEDWENISKRMSRIGEGVDGYLRSLRQAKTRPAQRQFDIVAEQSDGYAREDGFWVTFAATAKTDDGELPESLAQDLRRNAESAREAYGRVCKGLRERRETGAPADPVGPDRYSLLSRVFLGAKVDFEETYAWGQEELARVIAEQEATAEQIGGSGTSIEAAIEILNNDPTRKINGTDNLQKWMQETSDRAIRELAEVHFDIPEPVRKLECCIAPTQTGGIYYTGPNEDFSRPGRMWWSVPAGVSEFTTWLEKTTVYHEGVPGHHLQLAQTVYRRELLNTWRRSVCWVSGHGEGWALYAERLMQDLGYLDDPGDRMGMLDGQRMRAARVVLDIGFHLGLEHPEGGQWNYQRAWDFLKANAGAGDDFLRFELNRYLGWAGQAPSYKIGQRIWEQIRDEAKTHDGENFNLKSFHRRALDIGSVGLDVLRQAMAY